ncbi:hypothetical protein BDQ12DRAFT_691800 [Crucibulum laeve]|uniref:Uncharacterized protein n=1 Tax=Crucibulum laeve TaxID=68775 RepID=A0A5C3LJY0_9AGAR|nr:hypothetical protein BDQ12DRAFT_691800 [Crucibulum laeve]
MRSAGLHGIDCDSSCLPFAIGGCKPETRRTAARRIRTRWYQTFVALIRDTLERRGTDYVKRGSRTRLPLGPACAIWTREQAGGSRRVGMELLETEIEIASELPLDIVQEGGTWHVVFFAVPHAERATSSSDMIFLCPMNTHPAYLGGHSLSR